VTEPSFESYFDALALIEATAERRDSDAELIIADASLDTMRALASISVAVLLKHQETSRVSPVEATANLRTMLIERSVAQGA